jgi:hypothetical protein
MDWASSIQEQVNPFDFRKEYAISAFDLKHKFVFSYNYDMPFEKLLRMSNRLMQGWAISGVTRFSTGLPVTFRALAIILWSRYRIMPLTASALICRITIQVLVR